MMSIIRYFMRLEDKYWGLFLVSLLVFWILAQTGDRSEKQRARLRLAALYGAFAYLVFLCPLTCRILTGLGLAQERYYTAAHIWPVMFYLPLVFTLGFFMLREEGNPKKTGALRLCFAVGFVLILLATGKLAYFDLDAEQKVYAVYDPDQVSAYDLVITDAEKNGFTNDMSVWGPYDWMAKSRIYDARLVPIYGKDIADENAVYDPALRTLYRGFTAYEDEEALQINKDQQLAAIAYFMDAFIEAPCRYVTVFDPKAQGLDLDAKEIFEQYGYEMVGQAGGLQVYRFLGKES